MTLKEISDALELPVDKGPNMINQRLMRDDGPFFISDEKKPKRISLNPEKDLIVIIWHKYQCQICLKTKSAEDLIVRKVSRTINGIPSEWSSRIACCKMCSEIPWEASKIFINDAKSKEKNKIESTEAKVTAETKEKWEYLQVMIRGRSVPKKGMNGYLGLQLYNQKNWELLYEFDEGDGWTFLKDKKGNVVSRTITDILDDFGEEGWELVSLRDLHDTGNMTKIHSISDGELSEMLRDNSFGNIVEKFDCIFKKKTSK